jgi:DNA repair protein RadC
MNHTTKPGLLGLPAESRPREKLLARGPEALSDGELLALLLRTGIQGKHVLLLAQELLDTFGGVGGLLHAGPAALARIKGLGPAKRAELMAVMALARRALQHGLREQPVFNSPVAVREYLQLQMGGRSHEVFAVLFLDSQNRLIALEELFRGTLNQTSVEAQPSRADETLTQTLKAALALVDVRVLDHFVVTRTQACSMAEMGLV